MSPVSSLRESIEQASLGAVTALARLPRLVPFLGVLVLMVAGIAVPGWGWVFLAVVTVFLAWLLYLGWPRISTSERLMRVAATVLVGGITLVRAFPAA